MSQSEELHYTKNGVLDRRFTSTKKYLASHGEAEAQYDPDTSSTQPRGEERTLHYRKDGCLDKRYKSSKEYVEKASRRTLELRREPPSTTSQPTDEEPAFHYRKDGGLDMRFKTSKEEMARRALQNPKSSDDTKKQIPRRQPGEMKINERISKSGYLRSETSGERDTESDESCSDVSDSETESKELYSRSGQSTRTLKNSSNQRNSPRFPRRSYKSRTAGDEWSRDDVDRQVHHAEY